MGSKLLEALESISQSDLDEIVAELDTLERRADQLKELKRIIEIKLGLRKTQGAHLKNRGSKKPVEKPESNGHETPPAGMQNQMTVTDQYRLEAKRFIMANGPQPPLKIAKACGIPTGSITAVLKSKAFKQCEHGYELSGLS